MHPNPDTHYESVIHKQELVTNTGDRAFVKLPNTAKILSIQMQGTKIMLWYEWYTHPGNETKLYDWEFQIVGTGQPFDTVGKTYITTVQTPILGFVWHVYRVIK